MWLRIAVLVGLSGGVNMTTVGPSSFFPLKSDTWAFLTTGSGNYTNYRHQADVAHSYHTMLNQGIPPDRIIVMMYDDIAYNKENPQPGVIINRPNGPNVYKGLKIDYRGTDVTAANFLNILSGNKTAMKGIGTGRVIESNENSTVFLYFVDHGGPGVLFFGYYEPMPGDDLIDTINEMHRRKRYDKLIMFIDACFVGSLFEGILKENTGVWVLAGSARDESSYQWYCSNDNNTVCKGDEVSVALWEYMDSVEQGAYKTLNELYQRVRMGVSHSHVELYGDLSVGSYSFIPNRLGKNPTKEGSRSSAGVYTGTSVSAMDATAFYLKEKMSKSRNLHTRLESQRALTNLYDARKMFDDMMERLVEVATADVPKDREIVNNEHLLLNLEMFPCYKILLGEFFKYCSTQENQLELYHHPASYRDIIGLFPGQQTHNVELPEVEGPPITPTSI